MRAPNVDFGAFQTWGWAPGSPGSDATQPVQLLDQNLRAAIADELARRGYVPADSNPQLLISYGTASKDQVESNPVRVGVGIGGWGSGGGYGSVGVGSPSVRQYREGTLVIHAVDAARNAEVWQGRISGRLTGGSLEPEAIRRAVTAAMSEFPPRQ